MQGDILASETGGFHEKSAAVASTYDKNKEALLIQGEGNLNQSKIKASEYQGQVYLEKNEATLVVLKPTAANFRPDYEQTDKMDPISRALILEGGIRATIHSARQQLDRLSKDFIKQLTVK